MKEPKKNKGYVLRNIDREFDELVLGLKYRIENELGKPVPYSFVTNLVFKSIPKGFRIKEVIIDANQHRVANRKVKFEIEYRVDKI